MGLFDSLTSWLYETEFYKEHMSHWPAPLNDASFDMFLLLMIVVLLVLPEIYDRIRTHLTHKRIMRKNLEMEEKRLNDRVHEKTEQSMMDQFIRFMMAAQMKQMGMETTFEEYKAAKLEEEKDQDVQKPEAAIKPDTEEKSDQPAATGDKEISAAASQEEAVGQEDDSEPDIDEIPAQEIPEEMCRCSA